MHVLLLAAVLHEHRPQLPTNMLALMTELEKQGPVFATKMLITVLGTHSAQQPSTAPRRTARHGTAQHSQQVAQ